MERFLLILFFIPLTSLGQIDTIQSIGEVIASDFYSNSKPTNSILTKKDIYELSANDVGELIQKISGANLKSYGSLGGLKTVSMRGLGTNHSSIVKDGFSISNSQTGQVNLGQIEVDNVVSIISSTGKRFNNILPISAQISGSNFLIKTFENTFSSDTFQLRTNLKYGSFNQRLGYLGVKYSPSRFFISAFGRIRSSDGDYNYVLQNGASELNGVRMNNDYKDYSFGSSLGYKWGQGMLRVSYRNFNIQQGLPGAVILYNNSQDERMTTKDHSISADLQTAYKRIDFRFYGNTNLNLLNYYDPSFLNTNGGIDADYKNRSLTGGFSFASERLKSFVISGGIEEVVSDLVSSDDSFSQPVRFHNFGLIGVDFKWKDYLQFLIQASSQYVQEKNNNGIQAEDRFKVNPFFSFQVLPFSKLRVRNEVWYRNSFRMPSFNELYYNNIGNTLLEPENAHQLNYGLSIQPFQSKFNLFIRSNVYFNRVENKIVAIPTKNLFVWSMQNVGLTNIYGFEAIIQTKWNISNSWKLVSDANYSYQKTLDVTDESSPTYLNQIAYIPVHTANFDFSVYYRKTGFRMSNYFVSLRYSLNENVVQNEIDGFLISDLTAFYTFSLKQKSQLKIQFSMKNMFNQQYAYIRNFVMPGRNYLISLSYAFN